MFYQVNSKCYSCEEEQEKKLRQNGEFVESGYMTGMTNNVITLLMWFYFGVNLLEKHQNSKESTEDQYKRY